MNIDLEYAIKKDIRNNPVVREIDLQQKREFLRTLVLACLIVSMLLFSAWQHSEIVLSGYRLEELRARVAEEDSRNRQLKLELEVWKRPQAIEERAISTLHMVRPTEKDTIVIERVQSATPSKSVVAKAR